MSNQLTKKVLFIDFSETATHADSLYSQFQFFNDAEIYGLFHPSYKGNVPQFPNCREFSFYTAARGAAADFSATTQARKLIKKLNPDLIVMNTGQGNRVRLLGLRMLLNKTPMVAIHHNPQKFVKSSSQNMINLRLKKYLVMADYIKTALAGKTQPGVEIESFYPAYFEPVNELEQKLAQDLKTLQARTDNEIHIGVLGALENSRRDYDGLYQVIADLGGRLPTNLKFHFIGDSRKPEAAKVRAKFQALSNSDQFFFNDGFLSFEEMFKKVRALDIVMPLLHPNLPYYDEYREFKITGAYTLSLCYRKPLYFESSFDDMSDFNANSIYYPYQGLGEDLIQLAGQSEKIRQMSAAMHSRTDLQFEYQRSKYRKFCGWV